MIYVYCPRPSQGARELVAWLNDNEAPARRIRVDTVARQAQDWVVNWGADWPRRDRVLNGGLTHNKFTELQRLARAGVNVPPHGTTRQPGWLARRFSHQEANDLRANLPTGDYYVQYVPTTREFRVHIFRGASVRAGLKVPRTDSPDQRYRTWSGGWALDYGTACQDVLRQRVRDAAKAAVEALGYDFGAVDVGVQADGTPVVFEVNSAPGLEGNTTAVYGQKILAATRGELAPLGSHVGPLGTPRIDDRARAAEEQRRALLAQQERARLAEEQRRALAAQQERARQEQRQLLIANIREGKIRLAELRRQLAVLEGR